MPGLTILNFKIAATHGSKRGKTGENSASLEQYEAKCQHLLQQDVSNDKSRSEIEGLLPLLMKFRNKNAAEPTTKLYMNKERHSSVEDALFVPYVKLINNCLNQFEEHVSRVCRVLNGEEKGLGPKPDTKVDSDFDMRKFELYGKAIDKFRTHILQEIASCERKIRESSTLQFAICEKQNKHLLKQNSSLDAEAKLQNGMVDLYRQFISEEVNCAKITADGVTDKPVAIPMVHRNVQDYLEKPPMPQKVFFGAESRNMQGMELNYLVRHMSIT